MATYCYHDLENCLWFMMDILMVVVVSVFIVIYDACVANMVSMAFRATHSRSAYSQFAVLI